MPPHSALVALASCLATSTAAQPAPTLTPAHRLAVIVAHHDGGPGRAILQHAGTDAAAMRDVLIDVGGVDERDVVFVVDRDRHELEARLASLAERAAQLKHDGERVEVVVYYSGHADDAGLVLGREQLPWSFLKDRVDEIDADVKVVVLDACASGAVVRDKGGHRRPPLLVDARTAPRGQVWLTSSAADEASQESDRLGGSFFTHALVSGLRGGADLSGDGVVTLDEAYRYAFAETLARTQTTNGGAQHASFDVQLSGSGQLVLTDLRDTSGRLVLDSDVAGRVFVRDLGERRLVAEVTKTKGFALPLALPPGGYDVVVVEGANASRTSTRVTSQEAHVSSSSLSPVDLDQAVPRGLLPLMRFPINLGIVSPLEINSYAPRVENNLGLSLLFGRMARLNGAAFALGGNLVDEKVTGVTMGLGFNGVSGAVEGALLGATNFAAGDVSGVMGGLLLNSGTAQTTGAAWAVANLHNRFVGAQLGLVNIADHVTGAQVGLVNIARTSTGTQLGLVNLADSSTAPIGLVSLVRDGQYGVGVVASDLTLLGIEARAGSRHVFTQVRVGANPWLSSTGMMPVGQLTIGATLPLLTGEGRTGVGIDVDGGVGLIGLQPYSTIEARVRWRALEHFEISVGPELRVLGRHGHLPLDNVVVAGDVAIWPGVVVGVGL